MSNEVTATTGPRGVDGAPSGVLTVVEAKDPGDLGKRVVVEAPEIIVGRGDRAALRVEDDGLSRAHCRIAEHPAGQFWLTDLGSTNGTFLNGVRVSHAVLRGGDQIQVGANTVIRFALEEGQRAARQEQHGAREQSERTVPEFIFPHEHDTREDSRPARSGPHVAALPASVLRDEVARLHAEYVDLRRELRALSGHVGPTKKRGILTQAGATAESVCKVIYRNQGLDTGRKKARPEGLALEQLLSSLRSQGLPPEDVHTDLRTIQGWRNIGAHDKHELRAVNETVLENVAAALGRVMRWFMADYLASGVRPEPAPETPLRSTTIGELRPIVPLGNFLLLARVGFDERTETWLGRRVGDAGRSLVTVRRPRPGTGREQEGSEALVSEARIVSQLEHPNIVRFLELGRADSLYFYASEYEPRASLRTLLDRLREHGRRTPHTVALHVTKHLLGALAYAHGRRSDAGLAAVVHGRISPDTVLCLADGTVHLDGFGRPAERLHDPSGMVRTLFGDAAANTQGQALDVLSTLAVLLEMVTGAQPREITGPADARERLEETRAELPRGVAAAFAAAFEMASAPTAEALHAELSLALGPNSSGLLAEELATLLGAYCGDALEAATRLEQR